MAALNFYIKLTDTGDNGEGPYTATIELNSTTGFSGGTALTAVTNATSPFKNLLSIADEARKRIIDYLIINYRQSADDTVN